MTIPKNPNYRPRLSVEITFAQQQKLQKFLDHGMQKKLFAIVIDDVLKMMERHGRTFLAAVIMHKLSYQDYSTLDLNSQLEDTPDDSTDSSEDGA